MYIKSLFMCTIMTLKTCVKLLVNSFSGCRDGTTMQNLYQGFSKFTKKKNSMKTRAI